MAVGYRCLGLLFLAAKLLSLLVLPLHSAQAAKLVVLGDSLSDTGRAYEACNHVSPLSPPYFKGR
jgi:phospholipase/lecithinase/hemolysin